MRKIIFVILLLLPAICAAQEIKGKPQFTKEEFDIITRYLRDGSIPVLSDSLTMLAAQTLRAKADSVLGGKKALQSLSFSQFESGILIYLIRADIASASTLLRLNQKLAPVAANGKANQKKESEK